MRVAFFHDAPLARHSDGEIYSVGFPHKVWDRYLKAFDSIIVSTRMRDTESVNHMELSSSYGVEFYPISAYDRNLDRIFKGKKIKNQIRKSLCKADCAIIRLPSIIGDIACKEARNMKKPYLIELVGCPWAALWHYSFLGKIIAPFMFLKTRMTVNKADHVIYVTENYLQKRYPTKGRNINCSDILLSDADENILSKRKEKIKKSKDKLIIGTIGAVNVKYKGQQYVIEALGSLKKKGITHFEYHLVGNGNQDYLKKVAQDNDVMKLVTFVGELTHSEVLEWLKSTVNIYVQPSRTEGLPRALIEAMSMGLPSLGANAGGIPELLEKQYIFRSNNIDEIIEKLISFTEKSMLKQSEWNFSKAQIYTKKELEKRRKDFFEEFKSLLS